MDAPLLALVDGRRLVLPRDRTLLAFPVRWRRSVVVCLLGNAHVAYVRPGPGHFALQRPSPVLPLALEPSCDPARQREARANDRGVLTGCCPSRLEGVQLREAEQRENSRRWLDRPA